MDILVIGCGVSGLTTGSCLLEAGHSVTIWAKDPPTTFATLTPDDILSIGSGLRPVRSTVRLEVERPAPLRLLIHNYGHGGAGITLS